MIGPVRRSPGNDHRSTKAGTLLMQDLGRAGRGERRPAAAAAGTGSATTPAPAPVVAAATTTAAQHTGLVTAPRSTGARAARGAGRRAPDAGAACAARRLATSASRLAPGDGRGSVSPDEPPADPSSAPATGGAHAAPAAPARDHQRNLAITHTGSTAARQRWSPRHTSATRGWRLG